MSLFLSPAYCLFGMSSLTIPAGAVILAVIEGVGISINRAVSEGFKPGEQDVREAVPLTGYVTLAPGVECAEFVLVACTELYVVFAVTPEEVGQVVQPPLTTALDQSCLASCDEEFLSWQNRHIRRCFMVTFEVYIFMFTHLL